MKQYLLLTSALALLSGSAEAACIQTPTCGAMGYDSTVACEGGIKCPFGNAWNCTLADKITQMEKILKQLQQESQTENFSKCQIGDILYSDFSCNANIISSKIPIGIVFDLTNTLAMGLNYANYAVWSKETFDVPDIRNITDNATAQADWQGKKKTQAIQKYCADNKKSCPAFEYLEGYVAENTSPSDWYMPAFGEVTSLYSNRDKINATLEKLGLPQIPSQGRDGNDNFYRVFLSSTEKSASEFYADATHHEAYYYSYPKKFGSIYIDVDELSDDGYSFYLLPIINVSMAGGSSGNSTGSEVCHPGYLLHSDKSISSNPQYDKLPIAVIVDCDKRLAMGKKISVIYLDKNKRDIPGLTNCSGNACLSDMNGKNNTKIMTDYYKSKNYSSPAMNAINSYKTEGTNAGDWYWPAAGELNLIKNNFWAILGSYEKIDSSSISRTMKTYWYLTSSSETGAEYLGTLDFSLPTSSINSPQDIYFRFETNWIGDKDSSIDIYPFIKY